MEGLVDIPLKMRKYFIYRPQIVFNGTERDYETPS
jgi:hypothetical protein